ncbi:MvdC/MvdD family ATP grasp protein [Amycolatopsis alba]|uniref:ATP-grasp ribosomal peptide maturase n=1 Tax=Amycolatopsis alba DSM 44262 TaxID=1125972 RepID=A0A229R8T8_AMYAL|nr:hypothetical protein [Amycolatopsis alba]OXM43058.1 ATP-grasp ribosomal peptide maturase [Amycolatopsis alba DSM 44262]
MTVLVLARDFDPTADAVIAALAARHVPVFRTDLAAFPAQLRLDARLRNGTWTGRLWNAHHEVDLADIRSIWNRNPSPYQVDSALPADVQDFCHREAKLGFGGVLAALYVLWANHPNRCADAMFKPYQWKVAAGCGLTVADTVITNDPDAADRFISTARGDTITKALGPTGIRRDGQATTGGTRRLTGSDLATLGGVTRTAATLQPFVPKAFEVRLTVIGEDMFPIAIHAHSEAAYVDYRSDPDNLSYKLLDLSPDLAQAVARYMEKTGLAYAAFDFVVTPDGEWVMLEANTGPQMGWLEAATGAPITEAMATLLAKGTP